MASLTAVLARLPFVFAQARSAAAKISLTSAPAGSSARALLSRQDSNYWGFSATAELSTAARATEGEAAMMTARVRQRLRIPDV